jgi:hypothetical protein
MSFRNYILFFISSLIILFQFILTPDVINGNDLNGNIVPLLHFKESLLEYHEFPLWNPYINQGIPSIADPLYGIYNPIISVPILLFDYPIAMKVMYFAAFLLSSITMFLLLRLYKISERISSIIGITYACSSYLSSRVVAGHLEKVVSFAFLPLFIFCLIKTVQTKKILWSGLTAIVISLILFSGDIYNAMYCLYSLFAVLLFYLFKDKKSFLYLLSTLFLFLLFSSIKILPMVELQGYISKIKEPFSGGLTFLTFTTNLFFPFDSLLSKVFHTEDLSTGFGWWESLSFIGPFSTIGIYFLIKSAVNRKYRKEVAILILLSLLYLMLSMPGSKFNPYHYLLTTIGTLQYFHVPSRILALWSVVILLSLGIYLNKWKRQDLAITILFINLVITFMYSQQILGTNEFKKDLHGYDAPLAWIKDNNPNSYYTIHASSQSEIPQDKAYLHHILILQSNYGLFLKGSLGEKFNFRGDNLYDTYKDIKPGFLITNISTQSAVLKREKSYNNNKNIFLYRDSRALPFASINNKYQKAFFSPNKITIEASSKKQEHLLLLESSYPGWAAFIDGNETNIIPERFLQVKTLPGTHKYEFKYSSKSFNHGLLISLCSFFTWGFYILYNPNIIRKKRLKKS